MLRELPLTATSHGYQARANVQHMGDISDAPVLGDLASGFDCLVVPFTPTSTHPLTALIPV